MISAQTLRVAAVEPHFRHFSEMTQTNLRSCSAVMQANTIFRYASLNSETSGSNPILQFFLFSHGTEFTAAGFLLAGWAMGKIDMRICHSLPVPEMTSR
jgi:hypothetical protein